MEQKEQCGRYYHTRFQIHYKATEGQQTHRGGNSREDPEWNLQSDCFLVLLLFLGFGLIFVCLFCHFQKCQKHTLEKRQALEKWCWVNYYPHAEEWNQIPTSHPAYKSVQHGSKALTWGLNHGHLRKAQGKCKEFLRRTLVAQGIGLCWQMQEIKKLQHSKGKAGVKEKPKGENQTAQSINKLMKWVCASQRVKY